MYVHQFDAEGGTSFYICYDDGTRVFGPYLREQDAKGALTRLRNKHIG